MYAKVNIKVLNHSRLKEQYPVLNWTCTKLCFSDRMSRIQKTWRENLEKSVCIVLGRVRYYPKTSQNYRAMIVIVPVKFRFRRNRELLALLSLHLAGGPREGKCFDTDWRLIWRLIHAQIILKNGTATIKTARKKQSRHGCDWGDLVPEASWSKMGCNDVLVNFQIKPPYGRQN